MKLTLEYDGTEEREEYLLALNAFKWYALVEDITEWVRKERKYIEYTDEGYGVLDKVWDKIHQFRREAGVDAE